MHECFKRKGNCLSGRDFFDYLEIKLDLPIEPWEKQAIYEALNKSDQDIILFDTFNDFLWDYSFYSGIPSEQPLNFN